MVTIRLERVATRCVCCGSDDLATSPAILMPFIAHRVFDWVPAVIDESWGLSSIRPGNAYSLCKTLYCRTCGHLFLDIRFSDVEMGSLYADYRGEEYTKLREHYEPGYILRNQALKSGVGHLAEVERFLSPHVSLPPTVLDWGGDTGLNTPFKAAHRCVDIFDISDKALEAGSNRVSKSEAQSKKYDLVVLSHVLEHVPYPVDVLMEVRRTMREDSVLYIEVPLEDIIAREVADPHLLKRHWHEHVNFFSEMSLRQLARNAGLSLFTLERRKVDIGGKTMGVFLAACRLAQI
jgi:SAM-dependent methyltransferase